MILSECSPRVLEQGSARGSLARWGGGQTVDMYPCASQCLFRSYMWIVYSFSGLLIKRILTREGLHEQTVRRRGDRRGR